MTEKRRFERFNICVPARIEVVSREEQKEVFELETCNLSAEGIYFDSGKPLVGGSQVKIEIFLKFEELMTPADPDGTLVITATGRVVRTGPEGTAIRFNEDYDFMTCLNSIQKDKWA